MLIGIANEIYFYYIPGRSSFKNHEVIRCQNSNQAMLYRVCLACPFYPFLLLWRNLQLMKL